MLEFDLFQARARCLIALVGSIALLKHARSVGGANPEPELDRPRFLALLKEEEPVRTSGHSRGLDECFKIERGGPKVHLDSRNETTCCRISTFLAKLIRRDLDRSADEDEVERAEVESLVRKIHEFARRQEADEEHVLRMMAAAKVGRSTDDAAVEAFIREVYGDVDLPHPDYGQFPIFDLRCLKAEIFGLHLPGSVDRAHTGTFAVVREARGWAEKDNSNANLIVRDVLWLKPKVTDGKDGPTAGLYISAIDKKPFVIERIMPEEGILHIVGDIRDEGGGKQRLKCLIPRFDVGHPYEHRVGVLSGVSSDPYGADLASWKVLVVKPEWQTRRIDCMAAQLFHTDPNMCADVFLSAARSGVLYSNNISSCDNSLRSRRTAFRSLVADDDEDHLSTALGGFLRSRLIEGLRSTLKDMYLDKSGQGAFDPQPMIEGAANDIMKRMENILLENWKYVNPAQLRVRKAIHRTRSKSDLKASTVSDLRCLTDLRNVFEHVAYVGGSRSAGGGAGRTRS